MGNTDEIIRLESVWRLYRRWKRPSVSIKEMFVRLFERGSLAYEDFWALDDVSFSVRRGEVVGFCGSNGSGKSTLLKTISRIVQPSHGRVTVRGKVATLLEVATGFHPELSGRENIVLNGMLMGFRESEIRAKSDSIIEFAELGEFIDTPVRSYSAGMYMRLGFAIASHVSADILLIDEVLAVGDATFQKKCGTWFNKMRDSGMTVLIVSHDLPTLAAVCDRVFWLQQGKVRLQGDPVSVVRTYNPEVVLPGVASADPSPEEAAVELS